jgi:ATP-dependent helicase/nuclease subunit A
MEARSHLDWVLAALADEATLHRLYATGFEEAVKERNLFFADRIGRQQLDTLTEAMLKSKRSLKSVTEKPMLSAKQEAGYSAAFAKLEATLGQRYPFEESCSLCAKYSVSALTHRDDEFSTVDVSGAFEAMPSAAMSAPASGDGVDRRLTGSATHLVFEHLPLNGSITAETVRQTLEGLVREGIISETIARHIDSEGIAAYFATEPGQIALSERNNILREWPFTFGVDAAELGAAQAGETVIVQGIVDLIISTDQGLITADFKTDRITDEAALQNRIARYRQPLGWYARAASAILKQPVISSWLYFCDCRKAVQVS